jgi:hypothetical protein
MPQGPFLSTIAKNPAGAWSPGALDAQTSLQVGNVHGHYYGSAKAAHLMMAANQSGATTSAGLATTYTGFCLSNPVASGVNLSLIRVSGLLNVAPAALTAYGLITGWLAGGITVHTTPITPINAFINAAAPVGLTDAACTLVGTPVWSRWLGETPGATSSMAFSELIDGGILVPPGGYVAVGSSIAGSTAGLLASMVWEELSIVL